MNVRKKVEKYFIYTKKFFTSCKEDTTATVLFFKSWSGGNKSGTIITGISA